MEHLPPFEELVEALKEDFPTQEDDGYFISAAILVSSTMIGPDPEKITEYTGFEPEVVQEIAQRYQENGIWTDDGLVCVSWDALFDPNSAESDLEEATTAFIMDVLVGLGFLKRNIKEGEDAPES